MMDWDRLRVFHAVAEAGSFTHAGETLGLSQSAVSRQIAALEESLRVTLFHRHARGLVLTEQGEILYRAAREVHGQLSLVEAQLTDSRDKPRGDLRITTTVALGSTWLTPRMARFIEVYPDINVHLILDDRELDLSMREADVAIRLHTPVQPDLIQRKLFTVRYHVVAAHAYVERRGAPKDLEDLDNHAIITYGANAPKPIQNVNWLVTAGARRPRQPILRVNNIYGVLKAVEAGVGIAALPDYLTHGNAALTRLLPEVDGPKFDTYFCYPEELRNSRRINAFRDFMVQQVNEWTY
jgi:DNA-binding transcriptional LysR family regulator